MQRKPKYACIVFFPYDKPKKWRSVTKLDSFAAFLNKVHPTWEYMNVYDTKTQLFLIRFYPHTQIPQNI